MIEWYIYNVYIYKKRNKRDKRKKDRKI